MAPRLRQDPGTLESLLTSLGMENAVRPLLPEPTTGGADPNDGAAIVWDGVVKSFKMGQVTISSVSSLANLALLDGGLADGSFRYVLSLKAPFVLDRVSTAAPDGITVIAAIGGGNWIRFPPAPEAWGLQATWFIDPVSGSDENTGISSGTAIKTWAEWRRRVGPDILTPTTVTILSSLPLSDPFQAELLTHIYGPLTILGVPVLLHAGSITNRTLRAAASNAPNDITDGTLANWVPYVGKLIEFTMADASKTYAWILKDTGGGTHKARITVPMTAALWTATEATLVGNEAYRILDLPIVHADSGFRVNGPQVDGSVHGTSLLHVKWLEFADDYATDDNQHEVFCNQEQSSFLNMCRITGRITGSLTAVNCLGFASGVEFYPQHGVMAVFGGGSISLVIGGSSYAGKYLRFGHVAYTIQGAPLICMGDEVLLHERDFSVFDSWGSGIEFAVGYLDNQQGRLRLSGTVHLYGSGNTSYGVDVSSGARLVTGGNLSRITITASSGEVRCGGVVSLMSDLEAAAGLVLPATASCDTWAKIAAGPFNGRVMNHNNGAYIGP